MHRLRLNVCEGLRTAFFKPGAALSVARRGSPPFRLMYVRSRALHILEAAENAGLA
jgi:hypothetical protein